MAQGTQQRTLQAIPVAPFVISPPHFFEGTRRLEDVFPALALPDEGEFVDFVLPKVGIVSKMLFTFVGQVVVATDDVVLSDRWPYGLLDSVQVSVNGATDLVQANGIDLHVLRNTRYPAYTEAIDVHPGDVGGGNTLAPGTYPLHLTCEIPLAMDDVSLIGSIFAQSQQLNCQVRLRRANDSALASGDGSIEITGQWHPHITRFDIPQAPDGTMILPDLTRLHALNGVTYPFTQAGEVRLPLVRLEGQLARLFISGRVSAATRLSAMRDVATSRRLDRLRMNYGGNQTPFNYDPASGLLSQNNQHYGGPNPYDRLVFDFVKEHVVRDLMLLAGLTELQVIADVNPAVTPDGARMRLVQETLFEARG